MYQWRKALRRNMAVNCSPILLNNSWMAVELPMKVAAIFNPLGGMSHTAVFTLFGILSMGDIRVLLIDVLMNRKSNPTYHSTK